MNETYLLLAETAALTLTLLAFVFYIVRERQKNAQLQSALQKRSALVSATADELRAAVNTILEHIRSFRLGEDANSEDNRAVIEDLTASGAELRTMLLDALEIFEISNGDLKLDEGVVDLTALVKEHVAYLNRRSETDASGVSFGFSQARPVWVRTDPTRVQQCVSALLKQAAFQSKNVRVALRATKIKARRNVHISIFVSDGSEGMDQLAADKYFSPEKYGDNRFMRGRPAAMLSLNLAKHIAAQLGGGLAAKSAIGAGVTFQLHFRARAATGKEVNRTVLSIEQRAARERRIEKKAAAKLQLDKEHAELLSSLAGARVLAIDDNEVNLRALTAMLKPFGFSQIETATSGASAIEIAKSDVFDLVFVDIQMPGIDGFTTSKELRRIDSRYARIPIIAVSATSRIVNRSACEEAGLNDFIEKPVTEEKLLRAMKAAATQIARGRKYAA